MAEKARRLGRGLDFLLPSEPTEVPVTAQLQIELSRLVPNPWQPRKAFDQDALHALAESIRQHGVIQPVTVRSHGSDFQLVAGERRVLAARLAGLTVVPAVLRELSDADMLLVALIENVQRQDLNPIERARALKQLVDQHGKSHDEIATMAGLARSTVTNSMRLLDLDDESIAAVIAGRISEGHARALLSATNKERRLQLLKMIEEGQLNVRQAEIEANSAGRAERSKTKRPSPDAQRLAALLGEQLHTRVDIVERGTRGRIVIRYGSLKEFERIYERLSGSQPPDE